MSLFIRFSALPTQNSPVLEQDVLEKISKEKMSKKILLGLIDNRNFTFLELLPGPPLIPYNHTPL